MTESKMAAKIFEDQH